MFEVLERTSDQKQPTIMKNQNQLCKEYLSTISVGTELYVTPKSTKCNIGHITRGAALGEKFAEICKINKTSVWIKLNNGEIIKSVYPNVLQLLLKENVEEKLTIKEWRVISERGTRYDFTNEEEAKIIYDAICSQGDKAQLMNVWK